MRVQTIDQRKPHAERKTTLTHSGSYQLGPVGGAQVLQVVDPLQVMPAGLVESCNRPGRGAGEGRPGRGCVGGGDARTAGWTEVHGASFTVYTRPSSPPTDPDS